MPLAAFASLFPLFLSFQMQVRTLPNAMTLHFVVLVRADEGSNFDLCITPTPRHDDVVQV